MADTPASARPRGVSRRNFVTGVGAAGVGGLVVGGAAGWALKPSGGGSTSGGPSGGSIKVGSVAPITGPYSGDGQEMVRGAEMAVAEINAAGGVAGRTRLFKFDRGIGRWRSRGCRGYGRSNPRRAGP